MATLQQASRARKGGSPVAHLVTEANVAYTLVNTPETFKTGGHAPVFAAVDRSGRKPLNVQDSLSLMTCSFSHTITGTTTATRVAELQKLAGSGRKVRVIGVNPIVRGWWNITSLEVTVAQLDEAQNPVVAELAWTLTEASTARVKIGRPVTKLTMDDLQKLAEQRTSGATRVYTTRGGETLRRIAEEQLGDPNRWQDIANLNRETLAAAAKDAPDLLNDTPTSTTDGRPTSWDPDSVTVPRRALASLPPNIALVMPNVQYSGGSGGGGGTPARAN